METPKQGIIVKGTATISLEDYQQLVDLIGKCNQLERERNEYRRQVYELQNYKSMINEIEGLYNEATQIIEKPWDENTSYFLTFICNILYRPY